MQSQPRPQGPQSQVVCGGCRTLLMYPQGAQNVRCARCSHITTAPPPAGADMAQLSCTNAHCRVQLMYPRGAVQVQCSLCGTLNDAAQANQLGHVMCGGCQITLMYAFGAQSVKCAVCNHVTPAAAGGAPRAHAPPPAMQQPAYLPPPAMQYHQQPQQYHQQQYPQQYAQPPLPQGYPQAAGAAGLGAADAGRPPMQHVVLVENPPTLDDSGQEVQHVSLGMAPKAEPA